MRRASRILFLSVLCMGLLTACKGVLSPKENARDTSLIQATETYRKLFRWGYFEEAAKYIRGKTELVPAPDLARLARYKVTAYNPSDVLENEMRDEARIIAFIEYYDIDSGVASGLRDEQYWWYDYDEERWYLGSPIPTLGKAKK